MPGTLLSRNIGLNVCSWGGVGWGGVGRTVRQLPGQQSQRGIELGGKMNNLNEDIDFQQYKFLNY
jgi:hypothetical protein